MPVAAFNPDTFRDLLPLYYRRLFPYKQFFEWVTYGDEKHKRFQNREFSFTLEDDIYVRYQSFENVKEMEFAIKKMNPHKIDIGAIYDMQPKHHKRAPTIPLEKELVFDIDLTDYDNVRSCCQGADVCTKCWKFMGLACKILDKALRDDFGFTHLLWVFSGRRGIHCWVCDEDARNLDNFERAAVVGYLQNDLTRYQYARRDKIHPALKRALSMIEQEFVETLVVEQDILGTVQKIKTMLGFMPNEIIKDLLGKLTALSTSQERWECLVNHVKQFHESANGKGLHQFVIEDLMLRLSYPRLDVNVSTGLNHLLKAPFCVHPKTGKVCVPFNPKSVDRFNPSTIPTLCQLVEEVREFDEKEKSFALADNAGKCPAVELMPKAAASGDSDNANEKTDASSDEATENLENREAPAELVDSEAVQMNESVAGEHQEDMEAVTSSVENAENAENTKSPDESMGNKALQMKKLDLEEDEQAVVSDKAAENGMAPAKLVDDEAEQMDESGASEQQEEITPLWGGMSVTEPIDSILMDEIPNDTRPVDPAIDTCQVIRDYKKTSMYKGILVFEAFLRKLKVARSGPSWDLED